MNTQDFKAYHYRSRFQDDLTNDLLALSSDECAKQSIQIEVVEQLTDSLYRLVFTQDNTCKEEIHEVLNSTKKGMKRFTHGQIAEYKYIDPQQNEFQNSVIVDIENPSTQKNRKNILTIEDPKQSQGIIISRKNKENKNSPRRERTFESL